MSACPGDSLAWRAVCGLVLLSIAASACERRVLPAHTPRLRAAYTSAVDIGDVPSLMAHRALERDGYQVDETFFAQPELAVEALASEGADVASGGARAFWAADAKGSDLVMLMEHSENGYVLATVTDIGSCEDLDGRTLALSSRGSLPAALGEVFLQRCPGSHPRVLVMPHSGDRLAALRAGAVDAAVLQRPDVARLLKDAPGRFQVLNAFHEALPDLDFEGVFTSRRFLAQHRPLVVAYVRERVAANRRALADPASLLEEASHWPTMGTLDDDLVASEISAPAWSRDGGVTPASIGDTLAFFVRVGSLPATLDPVQIADLSVLDDALADLAAEAPHDDSVPRDDR